MKRILTILLLLLAAVADAKTFPPTRHLYPVISVEDGDTITVQSIFVKHLAVAGDPCAPTPGVLVIRLLGINAPEVDGPFGKKGQTWGPEARAALAATFGCTMKKKPGSPFLTGRDCHASVWLESHGRDRYGRTLSWVFRAPDGLFVNVDAVELGNARVYLPVSAPKLPPQYAKWLDAAEQTAIGRQVGIWEGPPAQLEKK